MITLRIRTKVASYLFSLFQPGVLYPYKLPNLQSQVWKKRSYKTEHVMQQESQGEKVSEKRFNKFNIKKVLYAFNEQEER